MIMADPNEPVHVTATEARAGATPGVARYVLGISLTGGDVVPGFERICMTQPATRDDQYDDDDDAVVEPVEHVALSDPEFKKQLAQPQREALILVGAGGFAYEEAAEICQVAVGTIKSRVARGRVALETILNDGTLPSRREHEQDVNKTALDTIMGEVDELSRGR
ncbi:hypothetical protein WR25_00346 [Diploscapter pachys]|uniref:RNA polymerase sigma factor 70 region 4 type 2 domain-containing protein n=1 Tax=Diploscapter pachys TaxID=2018661 RepID=A0A2A2K3N2_9BILA|nr:hypothetical protein WR25_00346 [Diploscapter pachys]